MDGQKELNSINLHICNLQAVYVPPAGQKRVRYVNNVRMFVNSFLFPFVVKARPQISCKVQV